MAKTPAAPASQPPSSQDVLDSMLEDGKDEHFAYVIPENRIISTGSLVLDSLVKVRSGGCVRLIGKGAELGKSSEGFVLCDNYMKTMPRSKTILVKSEARLSPEMIARSGLKFVYTGADWVYGTVFVFPCNIFERVADNIEKLLKSMHGLDEHLCIMIDSLDGLTLRGDMLKDVWSGKESPKVAGVQYLTKLLFRRIGLPITHYDALLLVTSQYSADIKLDQYAVNVPRQGEAAGGSAIAHQSDYVFSYNPRYAGDMILEDPDQKPDAQKNKIIGVYATIEIKKSGTDVTGTKIKIPIRKGRVGSAIWIEKEIVDMLLQWQLLAKGRDEKTGKEKGGAYLYFDPKLIEEVKAATGLELPKGVNGMENAYNAIEPLKPVVAYLFKKFTDLNSGASIE